MPRDPLVYLDDIITACDRVLEYTRNLDRKTISRRDAETQRTTNHDEAA